MEVFVPGWKLIVFTCTSWVTVEFEFEFGIWDRWLSHVGTMNCKCHEFSPEELAWLSSAILSFGNIVRTTWAGRADRWTRSHQSIHSNLAKEAWVSSTTCRIAKCCCKMLTRFNKIFRFRQLHRNTAALIPGRGHCVFTWKFSSRDAFQLSLLDRVETQPGLWFPPGLSCKRSTYFVYTPSWTQPGMSFILGRKPPCKQALRLWCTRWKSNRLYCHCLFLHLAYSFAESWSTWLDSPSPFSSWVRAFYCGVVPCKTMFCNSLLTELVPNLAHTAYDPGLRLGSIARLRKWFPSSRILDSVQEGSTSA